MSAVVGNLNKLSFWVNLWAVSEISLIRTKRDKKTENQNTSNLARTDAKYAVRFPSDDEF